MLTFGSSGVDLLGGGGLLVGAVVTGVTVNTTANDNRTTSFSCIVTASVVIFYRAKISLIHRVTC